MRRFLIKNLNKWVSHTWLMKKIFVNGYGSIGSRITSFLKDDPEITIIGVGKYSPDDKVELALSLIHISEPTRPY